MYRKLTPTRRILLLVAFLALVANVQIGRIGTNLNVLSIVILLVILLLELKDKLVALDELAVGRAVQMALLPGSNPQIPGWDIWLFTQPANEVGGDLVDYLEMRDDRWGLALGDVAGKGLGAALLMSKLQATLRALGPGFDTLSELGTRMNAIIYRDGLRNSFASLVYIELQPDSGHLRILNAGHLPPVLLRGDGPQEMPRGGPALGILSKASFEEQRIEIQPGEMLLVYSDGLTEAMNGEGKFFGEERFQKLLPELRALTTDAVGQRLLSEVQGFIGDEPPSDDLSLVVLKRASGAAH
jgi:serine phosphatase RsbU (regulator of sigma subunit)